MKILNQLVASIYSLLPTFFPTRPPLFFCYFFVLIILGSIFRLHGEKITAPDANASDRFGHSVSQSGNILAVGAYLAEKGGTTDAGAAYLFQLEANGSATYLTKVTAPDANASDVFGYSVSQSGNILAVGAHQADPGGASNAGAAYLYQLRSKWFRDLLNQGHRSRCKRKRSFRILRFSVGQYSRRRGSPS